MHRVIAVYIWDILQDDIIIWTYEIGYGPTINFAEVESPSIKSFGPSISGRVKILKP
jgi:hypothetical protein